MQRTIVCTRDINQCHFIIGLKYVGGRWESLLNEAQEQPLDLSRTNNDHSIRVNYVVSVFEWSGWVLSTNDVGILLGGSLFFFGAF